MSLRIVPVCCRCGERPLDTEVEVQIGKLSRSPCTVRNKLLEIGWTIRRGEIHCEDCSAPVVYVIPPCVVCGKKLEPTTDGRLQGTRFCSDSCKAKDYRTRVAARVHVKKVKSSKR